MEIESPALVPTWLILLLALCVPLGAIMTNQLLLWWRSRQRSVRSEDAAPSSCPGPVRLRQLLAGGLPPNEQAELTTHLENCGDCQHAMDKLVAGKDSWSDVAKHLGEDRPKPEGPLGQVMEKLKAEANAVETHDEPKVNEDLSLDFLSPATQPGHLGRLRHYEILEVVGRGGMGVVLKAFDPSLHRVVAIKVLAPQLATSGTARKRFTREAQAAAAVSHDHVVTIHAVEEANGVPYLVMQYIAGMSLQERLDKAGPLELREILRIGMQTAAGLAAAHAQGLIHRDIKPANILLENGVQRVKITDFGLARAADDASLTQSGVVAGTPQYMAPEQARGEAVDHRADLFSLGSVLYAMCTGRPPFCASTAMAVLRRVSDESPRSIKELNPEIPDWLIAIVEKLHAKAPADRFQSASDVAELWHQHLAQVQQAARTPVPGSLADKAPGLAAGAAAPITSLTICPSCGSHLHVPDKMVGRVVSCPQCGKPFQVADSSQEIQVIQAGKPKSVQAVKPRRKLPLWGWLLVGFFTLLVLGCGGVGMLMLRLVHMHRGAATTWVTAPARPPAKSMSAVKTARPSPISKVMTTSSASVPCYESLSWFLADATFFGMIDLRQLWGPNPVDQDLQRKLLDQIVAPHIRRQLITGQPENPRIDRISFAYGEVINRPVLSHLYVRLTGQFDHERVKSVLSREIPGGQGGQTRALPDYRGPITLILSHVMPLGCGLVGSTDVILAGYRTLAGYQSADGLEADRFISKVLELRDRTGQSLAAARTAELQLAPPHACGLLRGQIPGELARLPAVQNLFPVLPYEVAVHVASDLGKTSEQDRDLLLSFILRMKEGQERQLVDSINRLKSEGAPRLVKAYPRLQNLGGPLQKLLDGIKIDADRGVVSGDVRMSRTNVQMLAEILKQVLTRD